MSNGDDAIDLLWTYPEDKSGNAAKPFQREGAGGGASQPGGHPVPALILAHGAGAPMDSPFMDEIAALCAGLGVIVARFEFPYMAQRRSTGKKRPPDRASVLIPHFRRAIDAAERVLPPDTPIFIGGKSMGGRMASLLMAENVEAEPASAATISAKGSGSIRGVVCLGYPFHPPGKPEKLRTEHLPKIQVPVLILQGARDPFGMEREVAGYGLPESVRVHWMPDGNHDLSPRKKSGFTQAQNLASAASFTINFVNINSK